MNLKRGVFIGISLYIVSFIIGIFIISFPIFNYSYIIYNSINVIFIIILTSIFSLIYFGGKTKKSASEGLLLGILFLVLGSILDVVNFIIFRLNNETLESLISYYLSPIFGIIALVILIVPSLVGGLLKALRKKSLS